MPPQDDFHELAVDDDNFQDDAIDKDADVRGVRHEEGPHGLAVWGRTLDFDGNRAALA